MFPKNLSPGVALGVAPSPTEEELDPHGSHWRLAADLAGLHAWEWDVTSGRVREAADLERLLGLAPDTFAGTTATFLQHVHPADRARVGEALGRALRAGGAYEQEFRLLRADGAVRWVRERGLAVGGPLPCLCCAALDVTEARRAERRLRTQYAVTQALAEADTPAEAGPRVLRAVCECLGWDLGALWVVDRSAWVLRCVAAWHDPAHDLGEFAVASRRLTPGHGQALPGRAWEARGPVWVEDVAAYPHSVRAAIALRLGLHAAVAFPAPGGAETFGVLEFFSREIRPPDEDLLQMLKTTGTQVGHYLERKRGHEALRAGEELYRRITETAAEGILTVSDDGKVTFVNGRMARLLGYAAEEMLGRPLLDFIHPEGRAGATAWLRHSRQGYEEHGDVRFRRKDGKSVWALVAAAPLRDDAGQAAGTLAMVTDVTARRELEAQYRQAQKMEAIGRLAGGVAHDFNNLLTIISGAAELLQRQLSPGAEAWELAREIRESGERAAGLTRQLLAFSRKQVLTLEVLDLNEVVRRSQRLLQRVLGEDVELSAELEPVLGRVNADPGQMEQVIMNLAVNARDAMPQGGKFTLRTANVFLDQDYAALRPGVRPGRYVVLAVSDSGCGMDEETRAHLFEPFFTTKGPEKGTGLGLATVYGIVQQSGGHIDVESAPGRGTTFRIYLPRSKASLPPEEAEAARADAGSGDETVLLVEDEAAVRSFLARTLRINGYTVLEAGGGAEALRLVEGHAGPIQLLVTDVVMPGMSGRQLAERLTALRPEVRVLFLSGYTDDAVIHHGGSGVGLAFLQKPFAPDVLARKVREVLERTG
jgi:PAS domain S-box-containing protein